MKRNPKTDALLGFAARSRNLVSGDNSCRARLRSIRLLILAEDASEDAQNYFKNHFQGPVLLYGDRDHLGHLIGKSPRMVIGITDRQFARSIEESLRMET